MGTVYTQAGEELIVDYIDGTKTPGPHYIGSGTGAGTHTKASTSLFVEVSEARVLASPHRTRISGSARRPTRRRRQSQTLVCLTRPQEGH